MQVVKSTGLKMKGTVFLSLVIKDESLALVWQIAFQSRLAEEKLANLL